MERYRTAQKLVLKSIDDPIRIYELTVERKSHHLNQAQGPLFTVHPLKSLIGDDSLTSFSNKVLSKTTNTDQLKLSSTIKNLSNN